MSSIGIVVAMPLEARALRRGLPLNRVHRLDERSKVFVCGIGAANAQRAAAALIAAGVRALVSWGTSGGLVADLGPGALVLPDSIVGIDAAYEADSGWNARLRDRLVPLMPVSTAPLYSGNVLIETVTAREQLARDSGAVAVDMESSAVAAAAADRGLPFVCVRVVADPLSSQLPAALGAAISADGFIDNGRLLAGLARQPRELLQMISLAQHFRRASTTLRRIARVTGPGLLGP